MKNPDFIVAISQCENTDPKKSSQEVLELLKKGVEYIFINVEIEIGKEVLYIKTK